MFDNNCIAMVYSKFCDCFLSITFVGNILWKMDKKTKQKALILTFAKWCESQKGKHFYKTTSYSGFRKLFVLIKKN